MPAKVVDALVEVAQRLLQSEPFEERLRPVQQRPGRPREEQKRENERPEDEHASSHRYALTSNSPIENTKPIAPSATVAAPPSPRSSSTVPVMTVVRPGCAVARFDDRTASPPSEVGSTCPAV